PDACIPTGKQMTPATGRLLPLWKPTLTPFKGEPIMTTTTTPNGQTRKSLAQQIDRLDAVLDGLSEALQGAVADAVKDAVGQAVQEAVRAVLTEVLTNRDLQQQLQQAAQPAADSPQEAGGTKSWLGRAWGSVTAQLGQATQTVREASGRAGRRVWAGL